MSEQLNWIKPHVGKVSGQPIRSNYSGDGSFFNRSPAFETVGGLKRLLENVPDDLPIEAGSAMPQLVWYNVGDQDEHMEIEEVDDEDDEDDE